MLSELLPLELYYSNSVLVVHGYLLDYWYKNKFQPFSGHISYHSAYTKYAEEVQSHYL